MKTTTWIAIAAALALVACGRAAQRTGSAVVQVSAPLSTGVQEVSLRVYDAVSATYDATFVLTRGGPGSAFEGVIAGLPLNRELTFDATATDPADGAQYAGIARATLTIPGTSPQVLIVLQELTVPPFHNHAPVITGISASALLAAPGTTIQLAVTATDPNGDPLTYAWSVLPAGGTFTAAGAALTDWAPPDATTTGVFTFTVSVSDGPARGGTAVASIVVVLATTQSQAGVTVRGIINNAPVITGIEVAQQFDPATPYPSALTLSFTDADGPAPVAFEWSVDQSIPGGTNGAGCAGSFTPSPADQSPTFTPISAGEGGVCVLNVAVTDAGGAQNLGRVAVQVVAPPTDNAPRLAGWFQSSATVPEGGFAVVSATFLKGVDPLQTVYAAFLADGTTPAGDVLVLVPYDQQLDPNAGKATFAGTCTPGTPEPRVVRANPLDPVLGAIPDPFHDFQITFCAP